MGSPEWGKNFIWVYRSLRENWVWREKPFSPGQAWVDLLMRANWKTSKIPHPKLLSPAILRPGELICSKRGLSVNWGWSRNRVERYITCLVNEAMIKATNDTTYTRIKILNWGRLQKMGQSDGATNGATNDTSNGATNGPVTEPLTDHQRTSNGAHPRSKDREEGKKGRREDIKYHTSSLTCDTEKGKPSDDPEAGGLALLSQAKAKADLFKEEPTRIKVHEFIGYLVEQGTVPHERIMEMTNQLWNLRESLVFEGQVPTDKVFRYAVDQAIKYKATSISYVGKVLREAVMKWREGVLKI